MLEDQALNFLEAQDNKLEKYHEHEEVILWFDACLFDQIILIRQLDWFAQQDLGNTQLSIICIGDFPGFNRFRGLGELNPQQLSSLLEIRHNVSDTELRLAQLAWAAFCAPDPLQIESFIKEDTSILQFLSVALRRHLEQFPSTFNGLNRLENEALQVISRGHTKLDKIFRQVSEMEERPYFGDTQFFYYLDQLACARVPLIQVDGPGTIPRWNPPRDLARWCIHLTEKGSEILEGDQDWIHLIGIDRWVGGVHLFGNESQWRWNRGKKVLERAY